MPQNYFVTGMPKTGKTTIVKRVVKELQGRGLRVGGFLSPEKKQHGTRTGFEVEDIETGKTAMLASVKPPGPKVSKYHVKTRSFEGVALDTMKNIDMYDVYVIDEIGRMEIKSNKFMDLLEKAFSSKTPVIASVSNEYADNYKAYGEIMMLTSTNKEAVYLDLVNKTTESYVEKKPEKAETFPAKKIKKPRKKAKRKKAKKRKKPRKKREKPKPPMEEEKPKKPEKEGKGFLESIKDWLGF